MFLIGTENNGFTVIAAIPLEYDTNSRPTEFQVAAVCYYTGHSAVWRAFWQDGKWVFTSGHYWNTGTMSEKREKALRYMAQKYISITNP